MNARESRSLQGREEVNCPVCEDRICYIDHGDELDTLARLAVAHRCLRTPAGTVITRAELNALSGGEPGGVDLVPCPEHLDYDRRCAACRIVPAGGAK